MSAIWLSPSALINNDPQSNSLVLKSTLKHKIVLVAGTRPEAIKLIPVFRAFDFKPNHDLGLMQPGQTLPDLTARSITAVYQFLAETKPAAMLVQGDTTTVLSAAIAATYARVPIGHVEAGLRTYDMNSPFPEEMNRRLTSPLCRWSFAPTERSRDNLIREFIPSSSVHVTGNTVIDALLWMRQKVQTQTESIYQRANRLRIPQAFTDAYLNGTTGNPWILVTGHRRESFGSGFESICVALLRLAQEHPDLGILYPVHLNPNVREPVNRLLGGKPRIVLVEPAGYEDFIFLMDACRLILTDSGGVQEEAPSLGKPVLVMRETTERPEGIDAGTCSLVGTDPDKICNEAARLLNDPTEYSRRARLRNPYGDGQSSKRIRAILETSLHQRIS